MKRKSFYFLSLICFGISLWITQRDRSQQRNIENLPPFLREQIQEDLRGGSFSSQALGETWEKMRDKPLCVRYKWVGGKLYSSVLAQTRKHPRYIVVTRVLEEILKESQPSDVQFIFVFEDSVEKNEYPAPVFAFAKTKATDRVLLSPDCEALNSVDREYISSQIYQQGEKDRWESKREVAFWRGVSSGAMLSAKEMEQHLWALSPRLFLAKTSQTFPEFVDAALVKIVGLDPVRKKFVEKEFSLSSPVHPKDHLKYKYLIDVDGYSCCYSRTYWTLLSNSVVLKQLTNHIQWFYKGLKPNVHFVPLRQDLSDLLEKIKWCREHDQEAQKINSQARKFASQFLGYPMNKLYLKQLLLDYAKKMEDPIYLDPSDQPASVSLFQKLRFFMKGFLSKKIKKNPIAGSNQNLYHSEDVHHSV